LKHRACFAKVFDCYSIFGASGGRGGIAPSRLCGAAPQGDFCCLAGAEKKVHGQNMTAALEIAQ
jgi:hypothetical protein